MDTTPKHPERTAARPEMVRIWHVVVEAFSRRLDTVTEADWERATPCPQWSVRALVEHAVDVQRRYGRRLGYPVGDGGWPSVRAEIGRGLEQDDQLADGVVEYAPLGPTPRLQVLGIATNDLLVHCWDLARALHADESLPPDAVAACLLVVDRVPDELVRNPAVWGERIEVRPDADPQTRLLAAVGRRA